MPFKFSIAGQAVVECLLGGMPLTAVEAHLFLGYQDLGKAVTRLRKHSYKIQSRSVLLRDVYARIEATLGARVPVHGLVQATMAAGGHVTEYFVAPEDVVPEWRSA